MAAFRIGRVRLADIRRHAALDVSFAAGLTVVKGPNEAGKSSLAEALELGLTPAGSVTADALRTWGAAAGATPSITIDFNVDADPDASHQPAVPRGPRTGRLTRTWGPAGVTSSLLLDGTTISDPAAIDAQLRSLTGLPSAAFFRGTALVHHAELTGISNDATIRERLSASITAADRRRSRLKRPRSPPRPTSLSAGACSSRPARPRS
jgi:DNA repair exonuclease SbcCD ATPase subunit